MVHPAGGSDQSTFGLAGMRTSVASKAFVQRRFVTAFHIRQGRFAGRRRVKGHMADPRYAEIIGVWMSRS
jgi:hypothetical protein